MKKSAFQQDLQQGAKQDGMMRLVTTQTHTQLFIDSQKKPFIFQILFCKKKRKN